MQHDPSFMHKQLDLDFCNKKLFIFKKHLSFFLRTGVRAYDSTTKNDHLTPLLKFINSANFAKSSPSYVVPVKSKGKILQNFVAVSKYMNFNQNQSSRLLECDVVVGWKKCRWSKLCQHIEIFLTIPTS